MQLKAGQIICYINPENSNYYAETTIPQYNFGKVREGQTVLLKFTAYPFQEYGLVQGKIDIISHVPTDSGYMAKIALPDGLITNSKVRVQYHEGLQANAEIVTADMRLLQRFYYNLLGPIQHNQSR